MNLLFDVQTYDWTTTVSGAVEQLAAQIGLKNYQDYTLFEARKVGAFPSFTGSYQRSMNYHVALNHPAASEFGMLSCLDFCVHLPKVWSQSGA